MVWYAAEHPELWLDHEGHLLGLARLPGSDAYHELGYTFKEETTVAAVCSACSCGWRSPRWRAKGMRWQPYMTFAIDAEKQRARELYERHTAQVASEASAFGASDDEVESVARRAPDDGLFLPEAVYGDRFGHHVIQKEKERITVGELRSRMAAILGQERLQHLDTLVTRVELKLRRRAEQRERDRNPPPPPSLVEVQPLARLGSYRLDESYWDNPVPLGGVSGADLTRIWVALVGAIVGQTARRTAQAAELDAAWKTGAPSESIVLERYHGKISIKTAESIAARLHEIIAPDAPFVCDAGCPHVPLGATAEHCKRILDSLDAEIARVTERHATTPSDHVTYDDERAALAVLTRWRGALAERVPRGDRPERR